MNTSTPSNPVRVYYLSSGLIGAPILDALRSDGRISLTGVGSQPDRPVGRKQVLTPTAFARFALEQGCEVERIRSVNTPEFHERLASSGTEVLLVVSFGQLLKAKLLELPPCGCVNIHASLLPRYRGACPINAAILNGDTQTGVSFMRMDVGLDTGPVYRTYTEPILPDDTTNVLEARLGRLSALHVGEMLWAIAREGLAGTPQPPTTAPNVRKITKDDGAVNWSQSARQISNMIRAYIPWPRAHTYVPVQGQLRRIQLLEAFAEDAAPSAGQAGTVLPGASDELCVLCGSGILHIHRLIPEGRKEMSAADFLRGNPVLPGSVLE